VSSDHLDILTNFSEKVNNNRSFSFSLAVLGVTAAERFLMKVAAKIVSEPKGRDWPYLQPLQ
jgi:hypothetical protein